MATIKKVYLTEDNTILIVKASTEGCSNRKYVSVTADEIQPISLEDAKEQVRESLEDGEIWRMSVGAQNTELGLNEWVEAVLNEDELSGFDNSLYLVTNKIEGTDYIYNSLSCGCLHDTIKKTTKLFDTLINLHLQDSETVINDAERLINLMRKEDTDGKILHYTKRILTT